MKNSPILLALLLTIFVAAHAADPKPAGHMIGDLRADRVLFLGNSITLHGAAPAIGWHGNWGMAASEKEKDYVHLVTADLSKAIGAIPEIKVRNIADFERRHDTFDIAREFEAELKFRPNMVIVAIGENVPELTTEEARASFAKAFSRLLTELNETDHPAIFVRSCFWTNTIKDEIMRKAAADAHATFVDISKLGSDTANMASSERTFENAGVARHPGDKGMRAIADAIFAAIQMRAKPHN